MEALMQYVWEQRLWPHRGLRTTAGERIEVLDPGVLNRDAGPDFFNAKVVIGGREWVGNVEIHIRASDWMRHGHHRDRAYDSVVLHVVEVDDAQICRPDGQPIPQMVMRCDPDFSRKYHLMVNDPMRAVLCSPDLPSLPGIYITDWLTALGHERLYDKAARITTLLQRYNGSWTDAIYVTLARALGFSTNADPFELLAVTTPLRQMLHHADDLRSIEAILFGQGGMLEGIPADDYQASLQQEYRFMQAKFGLAPSGNIRWKMARMRPQNFPQRRIALLARMIHGGFPLGGHIVQVADEQQARDLFDIQLDGYWATHCTFGGSIGPVERKGLSTASVTVLIINVVVPVLFAYAAAVGDRRRQQAAIDMLEHLPPESNSIVSDFDRAGIRALSAFDTQALIQLRRHYCQERKCLYCRLGHRLLSEKCIRSAETTETNSLSH